MTVSLLRAKLHGLKVTGSDLHYEGSIALDPEHCDAAGLLPFEFVEVWNKSSGARISTYIIYGRPGSGCCVLNGAAARTCQVGDELIIVARQSLTLAEAATARATVLIYKGGNRIDRIDRYGLRRAGAGWRPVRLARPRARGATKRVRAARP